MHWPWDVFAPSHSLIAQVDGVGGMRLGRLHLDLRLGLAQVAGRLPAPAGMPADVLAECVFDELVAGAYSTARLGQLGHAGQDVREYGDPGVDASYGHA